VSGRSGQVALRIETGIANRALPGEMESGDKHVICPFPQGVLVAAIDGLGHGAEAALAARQAAAVLEARPEDPLVVLVKRCHEALLETRGAVVSLATFREPDASLSWLGVGNVQGLLLRADRNAVPASESLLLRGGVVGFHLPQLFADVISVMPGDILILATDGIRSDFTECLIPGDAPQQMANRILTRCGRDNDDALVVVARFAGGTA